LRQPSFDLSDISSYIGAKLAIAKLVGASVSLHGNDIFSTVHPLLDKVGKDIYGEEIETEFELRRRILANRIEPVLQRALELGLQTVVTLPAKYAKERHTSKAILALGNALVDLSVRLSEATRSHDVNGRLQLYFDEQNTRAFSLYHVAQEMQLAGTTLEAVARRRVKRYRLNSPNPQVSFAIYLANWIETCTGQPHYAILKTLIEAAFQAAGRVSPKWIDRLEIEMHAHRKHRQAFVRFSALKN
jgi:hypothetical protein